MVISVVCHLCSFNNFKNGDNVLLLYYPKNVKVLKYWKVHGYRSSFIFMSKVYVSNECSVIDCWLVKEFLHFISYFSSFPSKEKRTGDYYDFGKMVLTSLKHTINEVRNVSKIV